MEKAELKELNEFLLNKKENEVELQKIAKNNYQKIQKWFCF